MVFFIPYQCGIVVVESIGSDNSGLTQSDDSFKRTDILEKESGQE